MKLQKILCAVLLSLVFATCKKDDNTTTEDIYSKMATMVNVGNQALNIYNDTLSVTHDSILAINAAAQWLIAQPEVDKVFFYSEYQIEVHYVNGLKCPINIYRLDANGQVISRGGSGGNQLKRFDFSGSNTEKIGNKKVLVLNPYVKTMYNNNYDKEPLFYGGTEDIEVDIFNGREVTFDVFNTAGNYGLIILNTHGTEDYFSLLHFMNIPSYVVDRRWWSWGWQEIKDSLTANANIPLERIDNYEILFTLESKTQGYQLVDRVVTFAITQQYIRNAPFTLNKAVVFGNYCYSGGIRGTNMPEAWKSKGAISYYGYGYTGTNYTNGVANESADKIEDSLIINLVRNGDSTGIAHLANDINFIPAIAVDGRAEEPVQARPGLVFQQVIYPPGSVFTLKHFLETNYAYESCSDTLTDSRDQQKYATVCIGEQVWMAENLNWAGAGVCFNSASSYCNTYGRLYTWDEVTGDTASTANPSGVKGICPVGWHVPSLAEWQTLITHAGGEFVAGDKLRANSSLWSNGGGTDDFGFAALPGGQCQTDPAGVHDCFNDDSDAYMWTASKESFSPNSPQYISINGSYTGTFSQAFEYTDYFSCRCVKD